MKLNGRVFHLYNDAQTLRAQLAGLDVSSEEEYVYGVNTDAMISGRACTLGYTPEVLGPYFLENFLETVQQSDVKSAGFQVVVGGDAYGSGSSREVAVVAHRGAGIELVIEDHVRTCGHKRLRWHCTDRTQRHVLDSRTSIGLTRRHRVHLHGLCSCRTGVVHRRVWKLISGGHRHILDISSTSTWWGCTSSIQEA